MTKTMLEPSKVVNHEAWVAARKDLLAKEKEFNRLRDDLSRLRRDLPWEKVEKNYVFDTPKGKQSLADLFEGKSQLFVYHFMLGPGWKEGCPSCSYVSDHFDGMLPHLAARDTTLVAISRAPLAEVQAFQKRMGWKFPWASSSANDFNFDYGVSFQGAKGSPVTYNYETTKLGSEELPGASVFYKNPAGDVFHTYSTYSRGLDILIGTYNVLDLLPKGRDEEPSKGMAWVRYHDRY